MFLLAYLQDNGWKITSIDKDGDGDVSLTEVISYVNVTPMMVGLAIVFIWEISTFASETAGILLVLLFVLALIGFVFLRDWAKHDFYLSPTYQNLGNRIIQVRVDTLSTYTSPMADAFVFMLLSLHNTVWYVHLNGCSPPARCGSHHLFVNVLLPLHLERCHFYCGTYLAVRNKIMMTQSATTSDSLVSLMLLQQLSRLAVLSWSLMFLSTSRLTSSPSIPTVLVPMI